MFNQVSFSLRRLLVAFWWKRKLKRNEAKYQISRKVILLPGKSHNSFDLATCRAEYASNTNFVFLLISAIIIAGKLRTGAEAAIWQQNNSNHPSKMKLTQAPPVPWPAKQNCSVRCRKCRQVMTAKAANSQPGQSFSLPLCWPSFMTRHCGTVPHDQPWMDYLEFTRI